MTSIPKQSITDVDALLGRTFLAFGGATIRVDGHFPPSETHGESVAIRCLDSHEYELVQLSASTWLELRRAGAIVDA